MNQELVSSPEEEEEDGIDTDPPDVNENCDDCGAVLAETGWVATREGRVLCPSCASEQ